MSAYLGSSFFHIYFRYVSKRDKLAVPQFAFKRGSGQVFKEKSGYEITPTKWNQDEVRRRER